MQIHTLLHASFEQPGVFGHWAATRGHSLTTNALYDASALPEPRAADWLLVMGGPMGVDDERAYPWLAEEKRVIERAIRDGTTVIGVCLGAQLIASVLGARVYRHTEPEIGWFPVMLTPHARSSKLFRDWPATLEVFHWHGDTFDLPAGARHIAQSRACSNQAFTYGPNIVALQFHLELGLHETAALIERCSADLVDGPWVQAPQAMQAVPERFDVANALLQALLDRMAAEM